MEGRFALITQSLNVLTPRHQGCIWVARLAAEEEEDRVEETVVETTTGDMVVVAITTEDMTVTSEITTGVVPPAHTREDQEGITGPGLGLGHLATVTNTTGLVANNLLLILKISAHLKIFTKIYRLMVPCTIVLTVSALAGVIGALWYQWTVTVQGSLIIKTKIECYIEFQVMSFSQLLFKTDSVTLSQQSWLKETHYFTIPN